MLSIPSIGFALWRVDIHVVLVLPFLGALIFTRQRESSLGAQLPFGKKRSLYVRHETG